MVNQVTRPTSHRNGQHCLSMADGAALCCCYSKRWQGNKWYRNDDETVRPEYALLMRRLKSLLWRRWRVRWIRWMCQSDVTWSQLFTRTRTRKPRPRVHMHQHSAINTTFNKLTMKSSQNTACRGQLASGGIFKGEMSAKSVMGKKSGKMFGESFP